MKFLNNFVKQIKDYHFRTKHEFCWIKQHLQSLCVLTPLILLIVNLEKIDKIWFFEDSKLRENTQSDL